MYFLINHVSGEVVAADTQTDMKKQVEIWVEQGHHPDDITIYLGKRLEFYMRTKQSVVISTPH